MQGTRPENGQLRTLLTSIHCSNQQPEMPIEIIKINSALTLKHEAWSLRAFSFQRYDGSHSLQLRKQLVIAKESSKRPWHESPVMSLPYLCTAGVCRGSIIGINLGHSNSGLRQKLNKLCLTLTVLLTRAEGTCTSFARELHCHILQR